MMKLKLHKLFRNTLCAIIGTVIVSSNALASDESALKEGGKMVTLVNLHPDMKRARLYALNYQIATGLIPMCAEVTIEDIGKKEIEFEYKGRTFSYRWDKHTRKAGQSLNENFLQFFGTKCDQKKVKSLSEIDQKGIKDGRPREGMTKDGIMFAMGRPPIHATRDLESNTWMYWLNKFKRQAIEFDDNGIVKQVRL